MSEQQPPPSNIKKSHADSLSSGSTGSSSMNNLFQTLIQQGIISAEEGEKFLTLWHTRSKEVLALGDEKALKEVFTHTLHNCFGEDKTKEIMYAMVRRWILTFN